MKGIILAGGLGTRLFPITQVVCKQLLPVYDKPMIYYPLSVLLLAEIREILIISTPEATPLFEKQLGNGENFGVKLSYKIQDTPRGLADAFILGEDFIGNSNVALILGDNIFYGYKFSSILCKSINFIQENSGAVIFTSLVKDPQRFGIIEFSDNMEILSLKEKPVDPKSNHAITGLYFYDNNVVKYAKEVKPSQRGEIEITDLNLKYLEQKKLHVEVLGRGFAWLDTGTPDSLMQAAEYVKSVEKNQGLKIACLEEIAYRKQYISANRLLKIANELKNSEYGLYLRDLLKNNTDFIS